MTRSLALRLAALLWTAQGCYRYVTPAYSSASVSASVPSAVSVAYDEPMERGIWLHHSEYGPVWLPSNSSTASSLWADPYHAPHVGVFAWSPAISQWVWLDANADVRPAANGWTNAATTTQSTSVVVVVRSTSSSARTIDDRFKPRRVVAADIVTPDHVDHPAEARRVADVVDPVPATPVREVLEPLPVTRGPRPIPSAPLAGDFSVAVDPAEEVSPVVPMRTSATTPRWTLR